MRMRRSFSIAVAVGLVAATAACNPAANKSGPGSGPGVSSSGFSTQVSGTLRTSGYNPSDEVGKSRSDYATKQLGLTVQMDTTEFNPQKFAAQSAAGNVPDLVTLDRQTISTLADKKLIMPLDECYKAWNVKPEEYFYPAALQDVSYDGKAYGVPQFFQASIIIGNKRVMDPAKVTIADLDTSNPSKVLEAAKKMAKQSGGKPTRIGFDGDIPGSSALWLAAFGGSAKDDLGKPTLDNAKNVAALTWLKQLMDAQGGYTKVTSFKDTMDVFGDNNQFVKNQVGAQTWAQWYINVLSATKDKVDVEATTVKGPDGKVIGMAGGSAFAIPVKSKNPAAACAFAIKATSLEAWMAAGQARADTVAKKNAINTGLFTASPVADKAIREKFVKPSGNKAFDQLIATSYEALEHTVPLGASPVGPTIDEALKNAVGAALTGQKTPQKALADAQTTALRAWGLSNLGKKHP